MPQNAFTSVKSLQLQPRRVSVREIFHRRCFQFAHLNYLCKGYLGLVYVLLLMLDTYSGSVFQYAHPYQASMCGQLVCIHEYVSCAFLRERALGVCGEVKKGMTVKSRFAPPCRIARRSQAPFAYMYTKHSLLV